MRGRCCTSSQPSPELIQSWLERARSDLLLARTALQTPGVKYEDACFHAQQCAEKALKGLLSHLAVDFPRTHAIELLLDLLKANDITVPEAVDEAFALSHYAVQTRYPGEWEPVSREEADVAITSADIVLVWVETTIQGDV
jgi:HEPN domain-containing protein